jgi:hypothetical protein
VELNSSSDEALTSSRSIYLREIHLQIDHNEMLQRRLAHSTKLLCYAERIAMAEGKGAGGWPELLHLRWFVPLPRLCPMSLFHRSIGGKSAQASALALHNVYFQRTFLKHIRA